MACEFAPTRGRGRRARDSVGAGAGRERRRALDASIVVRAVPNLRAQLGYIADRFFDAPSASLTIAGITGTNGKTTCAWLLAQALSSAAGAPPTSARSASAIPGALHARCAHTTPDALTLQRLLAQLRAARLRLRWRWRSPRMRSTRIAAPACACTPRCSPI